LRKLIENAELAGLGGVSTASLTQRTVSTMLMNPRVWPPRP